MDKFDHAIIDLLAQNARRPIATIGSEIGLSRTAVNDRIRKLEDQGVIAGYTIKRGSDLQGDKVSAYFELTFRPFDLSIVKSHLQQITEVQQAHALSGPTDILLFVETRTMERLTQVRQLLAELPNLEKIVTSTALEQLI